MTFHDQSTETTAAPQGDRSPAASDVIYQERLTVAWWMWLVVLFVGATTFIALAPINTVVGAVATVVIMLILGLVFHLGSPRIVVTSQDVRVGRAYIERRFVGEAHPLRGEAARRARGPELDGRAFMNFRISITDMCLIEITDPVDPTPYWLTATRHPNALADAVNSGRTVA